MTFELETEKTIDNDLRQRMLHLRKRVFCDALGWDIPHCGGKEADVYDFHGCYYLNWVDSYSGTLLGSVRLMPLAYDNLMTTVFKNSLGDNQGVDLRENVKVWEGTRLCLNDDVIDPETRQTAMINLLLGLYTCCQKVGIEMMVCNCDSIMHRFYRNFRLDVKHFGMTKEFRHGTVHCLGFAINQANFEILDELARANNLEWPEFSGGGIRSAQAVAKTPVNECRRDGVLQTDPVLLPTGAPQLDELYMHGADGSASNTASYIPIEALPAKPYTSYGHPHVMALN